MKASAPFEHVLGITQLTVRRHGLSSTHMSTEQPRTDANSRERSPDHQYSLSIDQAAELYAKAELPRTTARIQKYCAVANSIAIKSKPRPGKNT